MTAIWARLAFAPAGTRGMYVSSPLQSIRKSHTHTLSHSLPLSLSLSLSLSLAHARQLLTVSQPSLPSACMSWGTRSRCVCPRCVRVQVLGDSRLRSGAASMPDFGVLSSSPPGEREDDVGMPFPFGEASKRVSGRGAGSDGGVTIPRATPYSLGVRVANQRIHENQVDVPFPRLCGTAAVSTRSSRSPSSPSLPCTLHASMRLAIYRSRASSSPPWWCSFTRCLVLAVRRARARCRLQAHASASGAVSSCSATATRSRCGRVSAR